MVSLTDSTFRVQLTLKSNSPGYFWACHCWPVPSCSPSSNSLHQSECMYYSEKHTAISACQKVPMLRHIYTSTRSRIRIRIWITIHMGEVHGLSLDSNPVCLCVNATNLDQDLDQNPRVNRALDTLTRCARGSAGRFGVKAIYRAEHKIRVSHRTKTDQLASLAEQRHFGRSYCQCKIVYSACVCMSK